MRYSVYFIVGAILILCIAALGLAGRPASAQTATTAPQTSTPQARTVSVSGHGEVEAQPDEAIVRVGVQTDAETAGAAVQANSQAMQKVLDAVRSAGVSAPDVQTEQLQLQPRYENPGEQGGAPKLIGYTATNTVRLRVRDLARIGGLLDAAVGAGANQIQGIQFQVSDPARSAARAREAAWRDAQAKAVQLAELAGAGLGDTLAISESSQGPVPVSADSFAARTAAEVPVEPGTQVVSADVQVTWALTNRNASPVGSPTVTSSLASPTSSAAATPAAESLATPLPATSIPASPTPAASPVSATPTVAMSGGTLGPVPLAAAAGFSVVRLSRLPQSSAG